MNNKIENKIENKCISPEYIYLLQEREFIKTGEKIYKIGKTKQENDKRFKQYPKGSLMLFQIICNNCDSAERELLTVFKQKFIHRRDIGAEYFEGCYQEMISVIFSVTHPLLCVKEESVKYVKKCDNSVQTWLDEYYGSGPIELLSIDVSDLFLVYKHDMIDQCIPYMSFEEFSKEMAKTDIQRSSEKNCIFLKYYGLCRKACKRFDAYIVEKIKDEDWR